MKTIKEEIKSKFIVNKSEFITIIQKVYDVNYVEQILDKIKNEYKDATHYCFAYVIDNIKKASDDKEPSGTAGIPILNVLIKNDMNYVIAIVVRYFGGIKLGAGGLTRAYTRAVSDCLKENNKSIAAVTHGYEIIINVEYEKQKELDYLLKEEFYTKEYKERVKYIIKCSEKTKNILENKYQILDIKNAIIEKESP